MLFKVIFVFLFLVSGGQNNGSFDQITDKETIFQSTTFLKLNPYQNAPLSAELRFSKPVKDLSVTVKGQDGEMSDISYQWSGEQKVFPVLGFYFDATNTLVLQSENKIKTLYVVISNKPSPFISNITVLQTNRGLDPKRKNFLTFMNPVGALKDLFAVDNFGKIRWYLTSADELHAMKFHGTNNEVTFSILNTAKPEILTYAMTGKLVKKIAGPKTHSFNVPKADKRFHHDMFFRDNGNILVLDKSRYGVEDMILELDPKGQIIKEILIGDWIRNTVNGDPKDNTGLEKLIFDNENNPVDEYRAVSVYPGMPTDRNAIDWAHINAISFDEKSQTIYLSFRQHGIFAFDYKKEKLKWIAIRNNYTMPIPNKPFYNLPEEISYVYQIPKLIPYILKGNGPGHPHAITVLEKDKFMVFDNSGNDGEFPQEGSRLMVFSVKDGVMNTEWEYKHKDTDGSFVYAQIVSDIDKTPFDSFIGTFGASTPFTVVEVGNKKNVLSDIRIDMRADIDNSQSDIAVPIACPTSRLMQNGIFLYRSEYQSVYPSIYQSLD